MNTLLIIAIGAAVVLGAVIVVLVITLNKKPADMEANVIDEPAPFETAAAYEDPSKMVNDIKNIVENYDEEQAKKAAAEAEAKAKAEAEELITADKTNGFVDIEEWIAKENNESVEVVGIDAALESQAEGTATETGNTTEEKGNTESKDSAEDEAITIAKDDTLSISLEENAGDIEEISTEIIQALEKLSFEAEGLRKKTLHLQAQTLSLTKEKMQLAEEKSQLVEEKSQLAEENTQLAEENETMKKEANALESLLQEKYVRIEELEEKLEPEDPANSFEQPYDIRTIIKDILPDLQAMANEAMVDFALKIDEIRTPFVVCDKDLINSMIIKMVFSGLRYSNTGAKLIFSISQLDSVSKEYAEFMYTCVYLGDQVDFYSEEAAELGGIVDIQRTPDGGVAISVKLTIKIDVPDFSNIKTTMELEKDDLKG